MLAQAIIFLFGAPRRKKFAQRRAPAEFRQRAEAHRAIIGEAVHQGADVPRRDSTCLTRVRASSIVRGFRLSRRRTDCVSITSSADILS